MPRNLWDQLYDVENSIRAKKGLPPVNALAGSPHIETARKRAEQAGLGPGQLSKLICEGLVTFSAIGGKQAHGYTAYARAAENRKPQVGEVAIGGEETFGLSRKALREGADHQIKIYPHGLDEILKRTGGPAPSFTVGDFGDKNIKNAPGTRFDIYRFPTEKQAREFGVRTVPTTIEVPYPGYCPPGTTPRR